MDTIGFRARCPKCGGERDIIGPFPARTPAELDLMERSLDKVTIARCPTCNVVEDVAMFVDGVQAEPWENADEVERKHGASAGPLRPKPWPDTN